MAKDKIGRRDDGLSRWSECKGVSGIYAVILPGTLAVKIGWSNDIAKRIASYTTSFPYEPVLAGVIPTSERTIEDFVLADLDDYRLRGEWFAWCDDVKAYITTHFDTSSKVVGDDSIGQLPIKSEYAQEEDERCIEMLDTLHHAVGDLSPYLRGAIFAACGNSTGDSYTIEDIIRITSNAKPSGITPKRWFRALKRLAIRLRHHGDEHISSAISDRLSRTSLPVDLPYCQ